jgi:hypothetical protein
MRGVRGMREVWEYEEWGACGESSESLESGEHGESGDAGNLEDAGSRADAEDWAVERRESPILRSQNAIGRQKTGHAFCSVPSLSPGNSCGSAHSPITTSKCHSCFNILR